MSPRRTPVSKIRTPRTESQPGAFERLWGIDVCRDCGTTIVLGESVGGSFAHQCASCRALPVASTPAKIRVAATDIREVAVKADSREGLSDAA